MPVGRIVGGGAGGLELATRLGHKLGRRGKAAVTLIDGKRTHLWKPLLHEIAAGSMDEGMHAIDYLAQAYWHGFVYRAGSMAGLDRESARGARGAVRRRRGPPDHARRMRSATTPSSSPSAA